MIKIGLTGRSGSGKGYVSSLFASYNIPCLDTDKLVHRLYRSDKSLIAALCREFGDITAPDGSVDRVALRNIVFHDKDALRTLNITVHSRVISYCLEWLDCKEREGYAAAIIDAPQLFEADMAGYFDRIISVLCPTELSIQRIMSRDGISVEQATLRLSNQMPPEEYARRSDFVINNISAESAQSDLEQVLKALGIISNT